MYLEQLITSAFPKLNPRTYGVINVQPEGKDWFVIAEQASMDPVFECGDGKEAVQRATELAQTMDLAFWAEWMDDARRCEVQYQGSLLTESADGLSLIPRSIVEAEVEVPVRPVPDEPIDGEYGAMRQWECFAQAMGLEGNTSFLACVEVPAQHPIKQETDEVFVLVSKYRNLDTSGQASIRIEVLDPNKQVFGKQSLYDVLREYRASEINSWVLNGPEDYEDESGYNFKYLKRECPLYLSHHNPETQRERVFIHEGGAVMEALAATRPWMVEKDKEGKALPLRISPISEILDKPTEEYADKHGRFLSSIVIRDKLTAYAREAVIAKQAAEGITREQVMPDGRQFKKVATIRDLDLEVMFDKKVPNTIGTREFFNYRVWVEGELVMDVHPGNKEHYNARRVSLSPMGQPLEYDVTSISDSQCGELLGTALTELQTDEDSSDQFLPERVKAFLRSSYVDEMQGDARALEEGEAKLVNGVFEDPETHQDVDSDVSGMEP